jgi:hypothetical protein
MSYSYYQLSVIALCIAIALAFAIWWKIRAGDLPLNEVQTRFATRYRKAILVAEAVMLAVVICGVPLPLGWGRVAIVAAACAGLTGLGFWYRSRLKALGQ